MWIMKLLIQLFVAAWITVAYFSVVGDILTGRPAVAPGGFWAYLHVTIGMVLLVSILAYCGTFSEIVEKIRCWLNRAKGE